MAGTNRLLFMILPLFILPSKGPVAQLLHHTPTNTAPRIAIIGGGIGGTATAFFLHDYFKDEVLIDLYESSHVGGRLATLPLGEQDYEVGGSVIHPANQYMRYFAAQFGLRHRPDCPQTLGLFDGEDYVFMSSSVGLIDFAKLLLRYGWDIYRLQKISAGVLQDFMKIYKLQHEGQAFKDVASMLSAINKEMLRMSKMSTEDWLREQGLSPLIISELVMSALQCNYGQTPEMQAFVGLIALAGADSNLWSVEGGNQRVAEELLKHSRASLLWRQVTQVAPSTDVPGKFVVRSQEAEKANNALLYEAAKEGKASKVSKDDTTEDTGITPKDQEYDAVILATPLTQDKSKILLANFTQQLSFPGHYEPIHTTLVKGIVQPESLMLNDDEMLDEILVTNPKLMFNSFGRLQSADGENCDQEKLGTWKIFSPNTIPDDQLDILFKQLELVHRVSWLAYPHYHTNETLGRFELLPGMYHLNAIEWAGSAMEMSVIGAKNVALLAYKYLTGDPDAGRKSLVKEEL